MILRFLLVTLCLLSPTLAEDDFPIVADDIEVSLFAREPLVRNPCAITFDAKGRLYVGMGPQYRHPKPDTPGDAVWILLDKDGDGTADDRIRFASGLNTVQGLAWRGDQLWIANAPDLTVVRDTDGDDVADEYVRLYTDLGNLEHGLHGLNWAPDGRLYMSKGNSKGLNRSPARMAPRAFRDLLGLPSPAGAPDLPPPIRSGRADYQKHYHDPADDWGLCGGILRCDSEGRNLEIVARGCRNPWDMAFDDGFNWLGTDNDQTLGDKFFSPFYGAHFGWGHPWSYDWKGDDHWPTAPSAGPLFEGSGTGVVYLDLEHYPDAYRGTFLVNDWLKRQVYLYRPQWKGAWMQPSITPLPVLARADKGRSMQRSDGLAFDPVDIELGPDGAIYISSWGREYGLRKEKGKQVNEGRIYRLSPKDAPPLAWQPNPDPWQALASHLPVWRADAQARLVAEGRQHEPRLKTIIEAPTSPRRLATWAAWTLGQIEPGRPEGDAFFVNVLTSSENLNLRIQALRILAFRYRVSERTRLPEAVRSALADPEARIRHEAILTAREARDTRFRSELIERCAEETDRIVTYSAWGAIRSLLPVEEKRALLTDSRVGARRAAALALLEDDLLSESEIARLVTDTDPVIAKLGQRRSGGKAAAFIKGPALAGAAPAQSPTHALTHALTHAPTRAPAVAHAIRSVSGRAYELALLNNGVAAYTDRKYKINKLPSELEGLAFIRVANDDADESAGRGFEMELPYPATIWLADDERAETLPTWARDTYKPTELSLRGERKMRLFRRDVPAGKIAFGSNREGVDARKGHYLVIVQPTLLQPQTRAPEAVETTSKLDTANAERGRTLFLAKGGVGCATCHRMEGLGNVFAPDLSDIGSRADADFIIRSILEPNADITEGFALQTLTKVDGSSVAGIVLGETGRALRIGLASGETVTVPRAEITKREAAHVSAMPPLGAIMSAQQVADITAYLLEAKTSAPSPVPTLIGEGRVQFRVHEDRVEIHQDKQRITSYYLRHPEIKRPFFASLKTPSGRQVTRNFPPIKGLDPMDHASMHPGLWLGFAVLDGENFWHNDRGLVRHHGFEVEPATANDTGRFTVRNRYHRRDGSLLCEERAAYQFIPNDQGTLITMDHQFTADKTFSFGVREEMGLGVRVATPIRVKDGGTILSGKGGRNEKGTWGRVDRWWDYAGKLEGRHAGVQLMSGPGNPATWSHSRDYGVMVANPFPVDRPANRQLKTTVEAGQTFRLRFGVQVHESGTAADYDPKVAFASYLSKISP